MTKQEIKEVLGLSEPWSLESVIEKLAEASNILLHRYNYDGIHWEEISHCVEKSKEYVNRLKEVHASVIEEDWIKIESEADLPKETITCWFISRGESFSGYYNSDFNRFVFSSVLFNVNEVTHYQPIQKPKPPIYQ